MELVRNVDFTNTHFGFADEYGSDKELNKLADRIIRGVKASTYNEAWVPLLPGDTGSLAKKVVEQMKKDKAVLYILPDSISFVGYEPKYVFLDPSFTKKLGAIDENVIIVKLDADFTKDTLLQLIEKRAEAVEDSKVADARREYERVQVAKFIDGRVKAKRIEIDRDLAATQEQVKALSNQLIYQSRRMEDLALMQIAYKESPEENAKVEAEIRELFSYEKLAGMRFEEDKIIFETKELSIVDLGGKIHPIGEFEVTVTMSNAEVLFKNIKNRLPSKEIPHPHCGSDGKACLGSIATSLPEMISHYDILGMWQIILSFLQSYNHGDSWGQRLKRWPAYDDKGHLLGEGLPLDQTPKGTEVSRETWHCDHCGRDHFKDEITEFICPICGEHFCTENEEGAPNGDYVQYNGINYCSGACVSAKKASEGVA